MANYKAKDGFEVSVRAVLGIPAPTNAERLWLFETDPKKVAEFAGGCSGQWFAGPVGSVHQAQELIALGCSGVFAPGRQTELIAQLSKRLGKRRVCAYIPAGDSAETAALCQRCEEAGAGEVLLYGDGELLLNTVSAASTPGGIPVIGMGAPAVPLAAAGAVGVALENASSDDVLTVYGELSAHGFNVRGGELPDISGIKFDERGLVPVVTQDARTGQVLMLAYMNEQALKLTLDTGFATYYSRSRQTLWKKGETSGHLQRVTAVCYDCDGDSVLLKVIQTGPACHTGKQSCFFNALYRSPSEPAGSGVLGEVFDVIMDRKAHPKEGSYTNYLFDKGVDKILKKVGEECAETIIAAKNGVYDEITLEASDLVYHLLVLLAERGLHIHDLYDDMQLRR